MKHAPESILSGVRQAGIVLPPAGKRCLPSIPKPAERILITDLSLIWFVKSIVFNVSFVLHYSYIIFLFFVFCVFIERKTQDFGLSKNNSRTYDYSAYDFVLILCSFALKPIERKDQSDNWKGRMRDDISMADRP
ncbi:hypothetical protein ACQ9LF_05610 [Anaerohalosphaeraceae bacterium U12dextr]